MRRPVSSGMRDTLPMKDVLKAQKETGYEED